METTTSSNDFVLESSLLKLPQELLRTNLKSQQRLIDRDASWLTGSLKNLPDLQTPKEAEQKLDFMIGRLKQLKNKIEGLRSEEQNHISRSRARLTHMHNLSSSSAATTSEMAETRSRRLIIEFMLRQGFSDIARKLASEHGIEQLLDIEVFVQSKTIVDALLTRKTAECLAWCSEHKTTLRKAKNSLEFELRRQEFIELLRAGKLSEAILYAQKNIAPHREAQQRKVDQVCALLCYPSHTQVEPYKYVLIGGQSLHHLTRQSLYAESRWQFLAELFLDAHHTLYNIPSKSPLEVALSAGLSALKTSNCYACGVDGTRSLRSKASSTCPVCSPELNELAQEVPFAHAVRSHLVDSISGEAMESENEPVVLPNGRVYGSRSLYERCKVPGKDQMVRDPVTGEVFSRFMVRKAYVL